MASHTRRKAVKNADIQRKSVTLFDDRFAQDENMSPIRLDDSGYYKTTKKKEMEIESCKPTSSTIGSISKQHHANLVMEQPMSKSFLKLMEEIEDAENEALIVETNIGKRCGRRMPSDEISSEESTADNSASLSHSSLDFNRKRFLEILRPLHSSSSYSSMDSPIQQRIGSIKLTKRRRWQRLLDSSSEESTSQTAENEKAELPRVAETVPSSESANVAVNKAGNEKPCQLLANEEFDDKNVVSEGWKHDIVSDVNGNKGCQAPSKQETVLLEENWNSPSSSSLDREELVKQSQSVRRSSFAKRRRSEKSGLIKIEPVFGIERISTCLPPIAESAESSIVELSDDLATITFDPDYISTPLKQAFTKIDRSALNIRRSKRIAGKQQLTFSPQSSLITSRDQYVQTSLTLRDLNTVIDGVKDKKHPEVANLSLALPFIEGSKDSDAKSFEEKLLSFCNQGSVFTWTTAQRERHLRISGAVKLGEGSYGEVFKCILNGQPIALKVVPVEGNCEINGEKQKTYFDMFPEVVVSDLLQRLNQGVNNMTNGFIKFPGACVVKGKYPVALLKAWDNYDGERINESPKIFTNSQKYVLLTYELGGKDLENFKPESVMQAFSIIYQAAYALAVAEIVLQFEHRDLHCGNILVNQCNDEFVDERLNGRLIRIRSYGVQVKLIDFTLSRLSEVNQVVYYDLKEDEEIFLCNGALHCDYYRKMRKVTKDNWKEFTPETNSLWTSYLVTYLYTTMTQESVGTSKERKEFFSHFKSLGSGTLLSSFLKVVDERFVQVSI